MDHLSIQPKRKRPDAPSKENAKEVVPTPPEQNSVAASTHEATKRSDKKGYTDSTAISNSPLSEVVDQLLLTFNSDDDMNVGNIQSPAIGAYTEITTSNRLEDSFSSKNSDV